MIKSLLKIFVSREQTLRANLITWVLIKLWIAKTTTRVIKRVKLLVPRDAILRVKHIT
jgi:hypothetical protein